MIDDETKQKLLGELEKSGNVYFTCSKVNVSRATYYRWKKENEKFRSEAEGAEYLGRENSCDIAEWALMSKIKEKDLPSIKYFLSHNSPRYKAEQNSDIVITHKKDPPPPEPQGINLTEIFQKINEAKQESQKEPETPSDL